MKNNFFMKVYTIIVITFLVIILALFISGNFYRKAYLSEFKFDDNHINRTLELNNLKADEIKKIFINTNDNILDNNALTNYIFTNKSITNYYYGFRIKYFSKIFKNSDIYGVYPNISKILEDNNYIKEIKMDDAGSPFGNLISQKQINYDEKIDNIYYKLKLKVKFIIVIISVLIAILLIYYLVYFLIINKLKIINFFNNIKSLVFQYKFIIIKIYSLFIILFIVITLILLIISKFEKKVSLSNFELITESPAGYVYKANFPKTSIFQYSEEPLRIKNKPDYIKNYGYSIEITNKPWGYDNANEATNWNNNDGSFTVVNSIGWNSYPYIIYLSKGEHYRVSIEAKRINGEGGDIKYYLDDRNMNITVPDSRSISTNDYNLYISDKYIYDTYVGQYPDLVFYFPNGEINIKYIKLEQIDDNLFVKENSFTIFTSNIKLENNESFEVYSKRSFNIEESFKIFLVIIIIYLLFLILLFDFLGKLKNIYLEKKKFIFKIYIIILVSFSVLVLLLYLIGKIDREAELTNFEILYDTPAGYVYKAKVEPKGILKPNFIYKYSDAPLKIENKPDYIKNYGYALEFNKIPDLYSKNDLNINFRNNSNGFTVHNTALWLNLWSAYNNTIEVSIGEKYRLTSEIKGYIKSIEDKKSVFINIDNYNNNIYLLPTNDNIVTYKESIASNQYLPYSNQITIYDLPYKNNDDFKLSVMFPNTESELYVKYIRIEQVGNLYVKDNNHVVFTTDKKISNIYPLTINYNFSINRYILTILFILIIPLIIIISRKIIISDRVFVLLSFILVFSLAIFHYWLCYPGVFYNWDVWGIIESAIQDIYSNATPVVFTLTLKLMHKLFGYNTHYFFTINIFLFYSGLFFIILSVYLKTRNKVAILLIFVAFIPNLFFLIINHMKDFVASSYIWLSYSLILFISTVKLKSKVLNIIITLFSIIVLIMGMLSRHNFIVLVYPMFILYTYFILEKFNLKNKVKYFISFISIMLLFAVMLIFIYSNFPKIFIKNYGGIKPIGIKLLQISACAYDNNDGSMIPNEWYKEDKNFEDLKNQYKLSPLSSDIFVFYHQDSNPINREEVEKNVSKIWIKYILKYPNSYAKHLCNFALSLYKCPNYDKVGVYYNDYHLFKHFENIQYFKDSKTGIEFTETRAKIYSNLYRRLYEPSNLFFIITSFLIFIMSGLTWLLKPNLRNRILLFAISSSLSAISINFIVVLYSPVPLFRYIYPVVPVTIISLISLIIFIVDIIDHYRKKRINKL